MPNVVKTPVGQKDKVQIDQQQEKTVVLNPDWKVTAWKVIKIGLYAFVAAVFPIILQQVQDSTNPWLVLWGPALSAAIRTIEGILRFHLGK